MIYQPFLFITYNIGRYTNQFCPRQTKHGDKPTITVHERQNRLIYQPILSNQDTSVKYTNQYCPRPTKSVDILVPTIFVYDRQNRLIYQPSLSTTEKLGEITTIIFNNGQNRMIYQPVLFMAHKPGIYNNQYCSRQTKQGDLPTNIVHDRQNRLI